MKIKAEFNDFTGHLKVKAENMVDAFFKAVDRYPVIESAKRLTLEE